MPSTPKESVEPRKSYTFDAIPEDEETQDELNHRLRKPGEPNYDTSSTNGAAGNSKSGNASQ
jgi:hypothetical protein